jgi:subtilisin family serine protease
VAVKVLSEYTGSGEFSGINEGIVYAANNGTDVINMSLGAYLDKNGFYLDENDVMHKIPSVYIQYYIQAQQRAVDYAFGKGVVIISSAGNGGLNADGNRSIIKLPAELNNVLAVSATAPYHFYDIYINGITDAFMDYPASYTDFGRSLVDLAAPGGDDQAYSLYNWHWDYVLSTVSGDYGWAAGTSMAAPHVSGVAALIIEKNGGEMDPHEIIKQLLKTADKIGGSGMSAYYGNGRVNAFRAVTE